MNRQGFRDALHLALDDFSTSAREPALIFIDLDNFKTINDTHGHETGDKLLTNVGARICEIVGMDVPISRLGGDEFAVIIQHEDQPAHAMKIATKIARKLSEEFWIDEKRLKIGASCGVARASLFSRDLDGFIKGADLAMYHAKKTGNGGAVLFEARMLKEQEDRRLLEIDLRYAIQHCEFEVFYQPLIDMTTKQVVSFEALLRWPHETRGMIAPDVFIPLAEELGLISQLGGWALREACIEAAKWPEHISIAVNLSPLQFHHEALLPLLLNVLATSGLSPRRLELEITESTLLSAET
ncbi:MAG: EAL domain-containing protein, partial [Rhizobiaceae bacterium]|nr:EAL domain-containing protein [Rhizobiaceae bacterium]